MSFALSFYGLGGAVKSPDMLPLLIGPPGPGAGTVTTVSVVTANGISGSVANATSTPAITLTLGAITPTSVAATGNVTGANLSGTNTGDQTTITGNAGTASKLQTARNINGVAFDGTAPITVTANTPNTATFNNSGAGGVSGTTFNGSVNVTVSYNTVGAPSVTGAGASGTWPISVTGTASNITGTAAVVNGGTGAVSLTSGALLKGNGTSPVTASVVTDDGTNVGIGRASPANKLDVNGSLTVADSAFVYTPYNGATTNTGTVRAGIQVDGTNQTLNFYTSNSFRGGVDQTGNVYAGGGATAMTDGFFYIPAAAGAPTGVPTAKAGRVPMYYDTTNNNFYVYNGAWKKVLLT